MINVSIRLLTAIESVGTKVELDWNGVYEAVTSNVGIAAIQPAVGTDIMRSAFGVDNLPTNSDLGFRSDQVHFFGSGAPDNVTGSISVPNSAALNNLGTSKRISFLAFSNDKLFISSKGKYDDVNSVVFLSATIGQTSITNLVDPVIVQLRTNMTLNNGSGDRLSSSCVFWDEGNQSWTNGDVDSKVEETSDSVVCHFNHLTNFATLLARDDTGNTKWLERLSIVGSSISSFFLVLTLLSMVFFCKRMNGKKPRGTVLLINLSLSLLPLNLLLIIDPSFVSSSSKSCLVVGILLHHSLLAALIWIALLVTSVPNKGIHNSLSKLKSRVWQASLCEILVMLVILSLFFNSAVVYGYSFTVLNSLQGFFIFSVVIICIKMTRRESHITTRSSGTQQSTGNTILGRPIKTTFQGNFPGKRGKLQTKSH